MGDDADLRFSLRRRTALVAVAVFASVINLLAIAAAGSELDVLPSVLSLLAGGVTGFSQARYLARRPRLCAPLSAALSCVLVLCVETSPPYYLSATSVFAHASWGFALGPQAATQVLWLAPFLFLEIAPFASAGAPQLSVAFAPLATTFWLVMCLRPQRGAARWKYGSVVSVVLAIAVLTLLRRDLVASGRDEFAETRQFWFASDRVAFLRRGRNLPGSPDDAGFRMEMPRPSHSEQLPWFVQLAAHVPADQPLDAWRAGFEDAGETVVDTQWAIDIMPSGWPRPSERPRLLVARQGRQISSRLLYPRARWVFWTEETVLECAPLCTRRQPQAREVSAPP